MEGGKTSHELYVLGMNDDLRGRIHGLGSETWKWFEYGELLVALRHLGGPEASLRNNVPDLRRCGYR